MTPVLLLLLQAAAAAPAPAAAAPSRDIVVTGNRVDATARALADCLARRCPPAEDIRATLAHAENQFVAGSYQEARRTLQSSVNRNRRFGAAHPVPVSDLFRAHARVAIHLGEAQQARLSTIESLAALRAGLDDRDGRVLAQRIEVADIDGRTGRTVPALNAYATIADDAHRAGLPVVEGYARLRRVVLLIAMAQVDGGYRSDLRAAVRWFEDHPQLAAFRTAAELMSAQAAMKRGDPAEVDALIARYGRATERPQLLFAPVATRDEALRLANGGSMLSRLNMDTVDDQWVDVSFWVTPEGRVADVAVLRESPKLTGQWVRPIVDGIARRRYAPLRMQPGEPGVLRVERYTFTAYWTDATGSRIRVREPISRIEMIDLTAEGTGAPTPPARS
jgi:hypothetical protein